MRGWARRSTLSHPGIPKESMSIRCWLLPLLLHLHFLQYNHGGQNQGQKCAIKFRTLRNHIWRAFQYLKMVVQVAYLRKIAFCWVVWCWPMFIFDFVYLFAVTHTITLYNLNGRPFLLFLFLQLWICTKLSKKLSKLSKNSWLC